VPQLRLDPTQEPGAVVGAQTSQVPDNPFGELDLKHPLLLLQSREGRIAILLPPTLIYQTVCTMARIAAFTTSPPRVWLRL
jgi:hypothetical protein